MSVDMNKNSKKLVEQSRNYFKGSIKVDISRTI